jgi:hypothetical protein
MVTTQFLPRGRKISTFAASYSAVSVRREMLFGGVLSNRSPSVSQLRFGVISASSPLTTPTYAGHGKNGLMKSGNCVQNPRASHFECNRDLSPTVTPTGLRLQTFWFSCQKTKVRKLEKHHKGSYGHPELAWPCSLQVPIEHLHLRP